VFLPVRIPAVEEAPPPPPVTDIVERVEVPPSFPWLARPESAAAAPEFFRHFSPPAPTTIACDAALRVSPVADLKPPAPPPA
jgi:hypothetical protein